MSRRSGALLGLLLLLLSPCSLWGEDPESVAPDYSTNPNWFPAISLPYRARRVPEADLADSADLRSAALDGKLQLSLSHLRSAVLGNNLELAAAEYEVAMAQTDVLRAKGGGAPRGAEGVRIPSGLFAGAIGQGMGSPATVGGTTGAGGITSSARQITARPRGTFDPSLALNFSVDRTSSPLNTLVVAGLPAVDAATTALQARFAQAFTSGTSLSVSFNNQRQGSTQLFLRFNPSTVSSFSVFVTQQLLNGFGFDVNRRFLTVAETGRRIVQEGFRRQMMDVLSEAETQYWELVAARENLRLAESSLAVAERFLDENRQREELGEMSKMEVFTAASEVSARRRDLVEARALFEVQQAELKKMLTRDYRRTLDAIELAPVESLPDPGRESLPKLAELLSFAVQDRPELSQAELNLRNQDVAVRYTRNLLKPTLVVFGMLSSAGLYGNQLVESVTPPVVVPGGLWQSMRQVGRFEHPEYAFGFSLQVPLLNRTARADHARARIERQQGETSLRRLRHSIQLEVRNAYVALTQSEAWIQSAAKAVELRRKSLEDEQEKLFAGLSTPYDVIRRQRDLIAAQTEEIEARSAYAKARVALDRATGRTVAVQQAGPRVP